MPNGAVAFLLTALCLAQADVSRPWDTLIVAIGGGGAGWLIPLLLCRMLLFLALIDLIQPGSALKGLIMTTRQRFLLAFAPAMET